MLNNSILSDDDTVKGLSNSQTCDTDSYIFISNQQQTLFFSGL